MALSYVASIRLRARYSGGLLSRRQRSTEQSLGQCADAKSLVPLLHLPLTLSLSLRTSPWGAPPGHTVSSTVITHQCTLLVTGDLSDCLVVTRGPPVSVTSMGKRSVMFV